MMKKVISYLLISARQFSRNVKSLSTGDKIGISSFILGILAIVISLTTPEIRKYSGLDQDKKDSSTNKSDFQLGVPSDLIVKQPDIGKKVSAIVEYINLDSKEPGFFRYNIKAKVNNQTYTLFEAAHEELCLKVIDTRDFDGNGSTDALVDNIVGCGGNCCADNFFFYSYDGDGHFSKSNEFGESWNEPSVEKWKGHWSVVVTNVDERMGEHKFHEIVERYILESGKAVLVESTEKKEIEAIVEIRSDDLNEEKKEKSIFFDLDGDRKKDVITCHYWARWHRMMLQIRFANGKEYWSSSGVARIGVLQTMTKGVHDLVIDFDDIIKWNGNEYDLDRDENDQ